MKRIIHALAALWPLGKKSPRTGPIACKSADLPIRKIASESAHPQISESTLKKKTIFHLERRYCNVLAYMTLFMCLIAAFKAPAQTGAAANMDEIQPLQIGDTIPEELWHLPLQVVNHPEGKETITLNDYRGKLIILDFWATWCGSCIAAMPRTHQMGEKYGNEVVILPLTYENRLKASSFLASNNLLKGLDIKSVVEDEALSTIFPHLSIPHFVWISPTGIIEATTSAEQINEANLLSVITGQQVEINMKQDIDPTRPLFLSDVIDLEDIVQYTIITSGSYDGLPSGNRFRKQNNVLRGRAFTNTSVADMYTAIAYHLFNALGDQFAENRLILEIDRADSLGSYESDYHNALFNYELVVPLEQADSLYHYVLRDLNRQTDYYGKIEKRTVKCLALIAIGDVERIKSSGGAKINTLFYGKPATLQNQHLDHLVRRLNDKEDILLPVVNEADIEEPVDLEFSEGSDWVTLKRELNQQNLDLVEKTRSLNFFVVEYKNNEKGINQVRSF